MVKMGNTGSFLLQNSRSFQWVSSNRNKAHQQIGFCSNPGDKTIRKEFNTYKVFLLLIIPFSVDDYLSIEDIIAYRGQSPFIYIAMGQICKVSFL